MDIYVALLGCTLSGFEPQPGDPDFFLDILRTVNPPLLVYCPISTSF